MSEFAQRPVTAVLGPTNTGKTHLAIERLCGHSSGMIGFPLRLLAREVYERVVKLKGANQVALLTGEEKILPPQARWFLCTAESMPLGANSGGGADGRLPRDLGFVAIDEAQLGADPERGHVFTDRLLRARGRDETMILGSDALRPMLKALVPEAEVIGRPRFSTLSYAGARKLSRLPRRSAIVAFSAEEVYAVAEAIRRLRGGAAVVMGALSPRTRNAQVAMFQAGEVDYLVATDAIGMGLNMDVAHVAFASLTKFDGRRQRRLTIAEMAQIAGRAGRHQKDGTFGALHEEGPAAFRPEEVLAIEAHDIPPLDHLYWRDGAPDLSSIDALIDSLEARPPAGVLRAAPQAIDLAVLKRLADEDWVRARVRSPAMVARLWAACGLPDFRKLGAEPHSRFVGRVFRHLSEGHGHVPHEWFAEEIARLDNLNGDVDTIAGRIAAARSWAYIAHRADWLAEPDHWAERTRAVEARLSDTLHDRLTQRFVDRRTTVLLRQIGADAGALPVTVDADGAVSVEDQPLGRLDGFRFIVAPDARAADKRMLLAAAEKRLGRELHQRARALANAADDALVLAFVAGQVPAIVWHGAPVATLGPGKRIGAPRLRLDRAVEALSPADRAAVSARVEAWLALMLKRHVPLFDALAVILRNPAASAAERSIAAALDDGAGFVARDAVAAAIEQLDPVARKRLRVAGVTFGAIDLFDPRLLKPAAARWRAALRAARAYEHAEALAPAGATVLPGDHPAAHAHHGYRRFGEQAVRIDMVERLARALHDARDGRQPFAADIALATSIGLTPPTIARLLTSLGFRPVPVGSGANGPEAAGQWRWHGRQRPRPASAPPRPGNAFAALAALAPAIPDPAPAGRPNQRRRRRE